MVAMSITPAPIRAASPICPRPLTFTSAEGKTSPEVLQGCCNTDRVRGCTSTPLGSSSLPRHFQALPLCSRIITRLPKQTATLGKGLGSGTGRQMASWFGNYQGKGLDSKLGKQRDCCRLLPTPKAPPTDLVWV